MYIIFKQQEETPKPNYTTTFHPTDQPYQPNPFPFHFYVCTHRSSRADVGFSSLKKGPSNDRISTPSYSPSAQARLWPRQAARQLLYAHGFHVLIGLSHHYYTFLPLLLLGPLLYIYSNMKSRHFSYSYYTYFYLMLLSQYVC